LSATDRIVLDRIKAHFRDKLMMRRNPKHELYAEFQAELVRSYHTDRSYLNNHYADDRPDDYKWWNHRI
jgi:hypothetical protein